MGMNWIRKNWDTSWDVIIYGECRTFCNRLLGDLDSFSFGVSVYPRIPQRMINFHELKVTSVCGIGLNMWMNHWLLSIITGMAWLCVFAWTFVVDIRTAIVKQTQLAGTMIPIISHGGWNILKPTTWLILWIFGMQHVVLLSSVALVKPTFSCHRRVPGRADRSAG